MQPAFPSRRSQGARGIVVRSAAGIGPPERSSTPRNAIRPRPRMGAGAVSRRPLRREGLLRCATLLLVHRLAATRPSPASPARKDRGGPRSSRPSEGPALRGEHLQREEGRVDEPLAVLARGEPAAPGQRDGDRRDPRRPGLHPHQPPRRRQGPGDRGPPRRRHEPTRPGSSSTTRRWTWRCSRSTPAARCRRSPIGTSADLMVGEDGDHDRQRLRLREHGLRRDRQRPEAERDALRRAGLPQPDPDRRLHQPGQLGRPADQHRRRADRDQRRGPRRGAGDRVRPADRRREAGRRPR